MPCKWREPKESETGLCFRRGGPVSFFRSHQTFESTFRFAFSLSSCFQINNYPVVFFASPSFIHSCCIRRYVKITQKAFCSYICPRIPLPQLHYTIRHLVICQLNTNALFLLVEIEDAIFIFVHSIFTSSSIVKAYHTRCADRSLRCERPPGLCKLNKSHIKPRIFHFYYYNMP